MNARINLDSLFSPASVAVVGASTQPGKTGWRIVNLLLSGGYQGKIFPVNPKGGEIGGIEVLSGISQIPDENRPLDLAVICLPAPQVEAALIELAALPLRAAIVLSAGFGETGGEGLRLEESLKRLAAERNIALLGPNSFGLINPARGLNVTFGAAPHPGGLQPVKPGNIAFFFPVRRFKRGPSGLGRGKRHGLFIFRRPGEQGPTG